MVMMTYLLCVPVIVSEYHLTCFCFVQSSQLGCACQQPTCYPEKCDHVYLFNNDYENAEDIYGKLMHGRFSYDDDGKIILEVMLCALRGK